MPTHPLGFTTQFKINPRGRKIQFFPGILHHAQETDIIPLLFRRSHGMLIIARVIR